MCGGPLFKSVCGISLKKAVIAVGVIELVITVIVTILNVVKYSKGYDRSECEGKDVCIGPLIKYSVYDAIFGVVCSLLLIFGALSRNVCLLISWMVIIVISSFKYIWVVVTHDWTSIEDWISITYLLFYLLVFLIVWSFYREIACNTGGTINAPPPAQPGTVVLTTTTYYPQQGPNPIYAQPPPYNENFKPN